ncbi:MAG TPA: hypothetical protein VKT70_07615 [Stellaceae bacterium]|nr:hypothetical protein [Stellaceae bacterium]
MEFVPGLALLAMLLAAVVLIMRGQSPVLMLLLLAIGWAGVAGVGIDAIQTKVIEAGGVPFASAVVIIIFGAWFGQILVQTDLWTIDYTRTSHADFLRTALPFGLLMVAINSGLAYLMLG